MPAIRGPWRSPRPRDHELAERPGATERFSPTRPAPPGQPRACVVPSVQRHLDDPDAAAASASSARRSSADSARSVRRTARLDTGRPGRPREGCRRRVRTTPRTARPPCSRAAKIAPPSSLATTMVRSGTGSPGTDHQSVRIVQERDVAEIGDRSATNVRPRAAPIAVETVPSIPASPRLPITSRRCAGRVRRAPSGPGRGRAASSPRRAGPRASRPRRPRQPPAAAAASGSAGDEARRAGGSARGRPVATRRPSRQGRSLRPSGMAVRCRATRPGSVATPRGSGHRDDLDVSPRDQPGHRPGQRGVPGDHHPFDALGRARSRAAAGRCGSRGMPVRAPGGRLGEQGPVGPLGHQPRRRAGVVARHHHRARPARRAGPGRLVLGCARRAPRARGRPAAAGPTRGRPGTELRQQRLGELQVEVRRADRPDGAFHSPDGAGLVVHSHVDAGRCAGRRYLPGRSSGWRRCRGARPAGRPTGRAGAPRHGTPRGPQDGG